MCWLADNYYVYCQHHSPRTIFAPCIRAIPTPGSSPDSNGLSRTGCWNSPCVNHVRVIGFCPACKISGRDRECDIKDASDSRYGRVTPPPSQKIGGDGHGIPDVQRRPTRERGNGVDGKIWLKSFGGQTPEDSRRNSVQSVASGSSGKSATSNPEVRSKSHYSTGANAAWGMTAEELRRRSTTLDSRDSREHSDAESAPVSPNVDSRRHNLSSVRESSELVRDRRRRMDSRTHAEEVLIAFREKLTAESREKKAMEIGGTFFAPYILAAAEAKAREERQAQADRDAQLRSIIERPCQLLSEVRTPHSKCGFRLALAMENVERVALNEVVEIESVPIQEELVKIHFEHVELKEIVSTVGQRDGSLNEGYEMEDFPEDNEIVKVRHGRKDSAICMDFDNIY